MPERKIFGVTSILHYKMKHTSALVLLFLLQTPSNSWNVSLVLTAEKESLSNMCYWIDSQVSEGMEATFWKVLSGATSLKYQSFGCSFFLPSSQSTRKAGAFTSPSLLMRICNLSTFWTWQCQWGLCLTCPVLHWASTPAADSGDCLCKEHIFPCSKITAIWLANLKQDVTGIRELCNMESSRKAL